MVKTPVFKGSCTAIVTPFTENGIDYERLRKNIDFQYENGISALVVCGTTGENATLSSNEHEELVAFGICVPSMAKALKKSRGRLFPTGWIGILKSMKKNDTLDMLLIAVKPELQGSGLNAVVMDHLISGANKLGIRYGETGPTLETNTKVQSQWNYFPHEQHKRRRCFVKDLD